MSLLAILKKHLLQVVDDIDSGNCSMSEAELEQAICYLQQFNSRDRRLNRTEAAEHLHLSQRTFDRYVQEGRIPPGEHHRGDRQKTWSASSLDKLRF